MVIFITNTNCEKLAYRSFGSEECSALNTPPPAGLDCGRGGRIKPSRGRFSTRQTSFPLGTGSISQRSPFIADGSTKFKSLSCVGGQPRPAQFSQPSLRARNGSSQASLTEPCITGVMSQPFMEGLGCTTLTWTVPTLTQHFRTTMTTSSPSRVFSQESV